MRVPSALVLVAAAGVLQVTAAGQQAAPTPPPPSDIYLVQLTGGLPSMHTAKPMPLSVAPGYDNQPMFSADGRRLLFAGNRDGKQIDIYQYDRDANRVSQLTDTAENENSPTYLPDGVGDRGGFSVVRTEPDRAQRLWRFDALGRNPHVVLTDVKPVGYHAWIDAQHVILFVLGQPATLQVADVTTGRAEIAASNIGRSLHRIPGTQAGSFVQRDASGEFWIKRIDLPSKAIVPIVKAVESSADRDMAWMPDGRTILMSAGTKIMSFTTGTTGTSAWTEVFDASAHNLGAVSRLAVSPRGDAVAIVVAERNPAAGKN